MESYDIIVISLYKTYREFHIEPVQREILQEIITDSVRVYITIIEQKQPDYSKILNINFQYSGEIMKQQKHLYKTLVFIISFILVSFAYIVLISNELTNTRDGLWHGINYQSFSWEYGIGRCMAFYEFFII